MSRRQRGRKPSVPHTVMIRGPAAEVDLMMECVDDELSPWQLQANRRAQTEYNAAVERIKRAQQGNVPIVTGSVIEGDVDDDVIVLDDDDPDYMPSTSAPATSSKRRSGKRQTTPSKKAQAAAPAQQFVMQTMSGHPGQQIIIPQASVYPTTSPVQRPVGVVSPQGNQTPAGRSAGRNQKKPAGETKATKTKPGTKQIVQGKKHAPTPNKPQAIASSKSQEFGSPVQKHQQGFQNALKLKLSKTSSPDGSGDRWVAKKVSSHPDDGIDWKLVGRKQGTDFLLSPCSVVVNKFTESLLPGEKLSNVDVRRVRSLKKNADVDLKLSPRKGYVYVTRAQKITPTRSPKFDTDDTIEASEIRADKVKLTTRSGKVFSDSKVDDLRLKTRKGTVISKPQSFDFAKKKLVNAKANLAARGKQNNKLNESTKVEQVTTRATRSKGQSLLSLVDLESSLSKKVQVAKNDSADVDDDDQGWDYGGDDYVDDDDDDDNSALVKGVGKKVGFADDIQKVKREMEKKLEEETSKYEEKIKQLEEKQRTEIERLMLAVKQSNKTTRSLFEGPVLKENVNRQEKEEAKEKKPTRRRSESSLLTDFHVETVRVDAKTDAPVTTRSGLLRRSNATTVNTPPHRSTRSVIDKVSKSAPQSSKFQRESGRLRHPTVPVSSKLRQPLRLKSKLHTRSGSSSQLRSNARAPGLSDDSGTNSSKMRDTSVLKSRLRHAQDLKSSKMREASVLKSRLRHTKSLKSSKMYGTHSLKSSKLRNVPGSKSSKMPDVSVKSPKLTRIPDPKSSKLRPSLETKSSKLHREPGPKVSKLRHLPAPKSKQKQRLAGPKSASRKRLSKSSSISSSRKRPKIDLCVYQFDDMQLAMDVCVELDRCSESRSRSLFEPSMTAGGGFPSLMVIGTIERVADGTPEAQTTETSAQTNEIVLELDEIKLEPVDHATATEIVSGTYGLGIKRTAMGGDAAEPSPKKGRGPRSKQQQTEDTGAWVPLDEYYYGKKEGDPAYREEKGEVRFKCWYCHKMLYNNMRIMMHMQGHIDTEKQQNIDLSDITQCKHCYKQFDTPFEMQCHVEKIHQNKSNVLVCRICEKDHDSQASLRNHMRNCHTSCEMPYICQLCNFRSSIYSDVVDHFKKRHDSSHYLMCLYCLKVFKVNFSKSHGWGLTQNYYHHLQKHQIKNVTKKCTSCKLTYLNKQDAKIHKQKDHMANYKGTRASSASLSTTTPNQEQVMIKLLDTANPKASQPKSLNAPVSSKVRELRGLKYSLGPDGEDLKCVECKSIMGSPEHFKKYVECSMCRYATTCSHSYISHMMGFHSGNVTVRKEISSKERKMAEVMYCLCGYSSQYGNIIANHMVSCSKRTSYKEPPQQKIIEYDDEQEDFDPFAPDVEEPDEPETEETPSKAGNEMFLGIFGLMKKPGRGNKSRDQVLEVELTPKEIAESILDDVLDAIFPAEAAAHDFLNKLLERLDRELLPKDVLPVMEPPALSPDDIPDDLKGEQKWSTVKISEKNVPSKSSIFGGIDEDEDASRDDSKEGDTEMAEEKTGEKDDEEAKMEETEDEPKIETNFRPQNVEDLDSKEELEDTKKDTEEKREETADYIEERKKETNDVGVEERMDERKDDIKKKPEDDVDEKKKETNEDDEERSDEKKDDIKKKPEEDDADEEKREISEDVEERSDQSKDDVEKKLEEDDVDEEKRETNEDIEERSDESKDDVEKKPEEDDVDEEKRETSEDVEDSLRSDESKDDVEKKPEDDVDEEKEETNPDIEERSDESKYDVKKKQEDDFEDSRMERNDVEGTWEEKADVEKEPEGTEKTELTQRNNEESETMDTDPTTSDAPEEPIEQKAEEHKPVEDVSPISPGEEAMDEDPGTPTVDEPMETAEERQPVEPQDKVDSVLSEPVPESSEATASEEVAEKSEEKPVEIQAEQEERFAEQKSGAQASYEESREVPTMKERERKDSGESKQTEDHGKDEKRIEDESERTSNVTSKYPEETGKSLEEQPQVPESVLVSSKLEESSQPSVPEQESTYTPGLPAIPPLIPSTQSALPAAGTGRVEEFAPQAGYSDRRDGYRRSDSDRYDRDRDRDYYRNRDRDRDRDYYRRDDRGYDRDRSYDRDRGYDRDRNYDRRDSYNRDRYGGGGGGGYHSSRGRYDDYNRRGGGGYNRHDNRQGGGGGYHRDNRRGGSGSSGGYYDNRGYYQ